MKSVIFVLLSLISNSLIANVCEVKSGEIRLVGAEARYSAKDGWIDDCSGAIELVSEQAEICLFNQLKQWQCRVRRQRDGAITINTLQVGPEYATGFFATLKSLFELDTNIESGDLRPRDDKILPGFPYGKILAPVGTMQLNIAGAASETISRFVLLDLESNQEIFTFDDPPRVVSIPASLFRPGKNYQWQMHAPAKQYTGDFSMAVTEDQRKFEQDFNSALPEDGLPDTARTLLHAVVAREYGYTFDYQQSLYKARRSITSELTGRTP